MKTLLPFLVAVSAVAPAPAPWPAQSKNAGKTHVRHIFVSVTDSKGAPVEGLSASDFEVSEGGSRESSHTPGRRRIRCGSR